MNRPPRRGTIKSEIEAMLRDGRIVQRRRPDGQMGPYLPEDAPPEAT